MKLNPSIVAIVNDGIKSHQPLPKYGVKLVTSYQDLRTVNWKFINSLIIQAELNWVNRRGSAQSTYDGYYLLVELLDWAIKFKGTVGFVTRQNSNIYNESNNRLYPFMLKVPCESLSKREDTSDFDKRFLMKYYHTVFPNLQHEYDSGFIQLNTGNMSKKYLIKHQKGQEIVFVKCNVNNEYIIRIKNFWGFYKQIGRVDLEHEVLGFLRRKFAPVLSIQAIEFEG